ncbi:hypothetical protein U3C50_001042 [Providencia rettgeri]|nr:hypothetical protein [Providencia rettgeri]QPB12010.1 hypothetical protein [Providencia phage PSTCR3]
MKTWQCLVHIIMILIMFALAFIAKSHVKYVDITNVISVLQNISAIVFAITGVWIAYLYPNAIAGLTKNEKIDFFASKNEAKKVESLVLVIIVSALVLVLIGVFYLVSIPVKGTSFYIEYLDYIKLVGTFYVFTLLYIEIICILMIVANSISFVNGLYRFLTDKELDDKLK